MRSRKASVPPYVRRAKRRFLEGLWYRSPVEAVLAGRRTLEEWADLLNVERERERSLDKAAGQAIGQRSSVTSGRRL